MALSRVAASGPALLTALTRAEAATGELTTRGASALSALRSAVAAVSAAAANAKATAAAAAKNADAAAALVPPSLADKEVQAVWDAALKLWVRIWFLKKRASERSWASFFFPSSSSFLPSLLSHQQSISSFLPSLPPNEEQNTCVDACNGIQPPAWHVDARQLAW